MSAPRQGLAQRSHLPTRHRGDLGWRDKAICTHRNPELFFPRSKKRAEAKPAKAVCQSCPVVQPCLEYALAADERYGVWGGLSETERYELTRRPPR
jgi:WhiB family redox-sensing transcriptional regulator